MPLSSTRSDPVSGSASGPAAGQDLAVPRRSAPLAVPVAGFVPPGMAYDASSDLAQASAGAAASKGDVSIKLQATAVCEGETAADALQDAADFARTSPRPVVHSVAVARVPGPTEATWSWRATLVISYPDAWGDTTGDTHHADPPPSAS